MSWRRAVLLLGLAFLSAIAWLSGDRAYVWLTSGMSYMHNIDRVEEARLGFLCVSISCLEFAVVAITASHGRWPKRVLAVVPGALALWWAAHARALAPPTGWTFYTAYDPTALGRQMEYARLARDAGLVHLAVVVGLLALAVRRSD